MATTEATPSGLRGLLSALGLGALVGGLLFVVTLGLWGEFGWVLRGLRLVEPPDRETPTGLLRVAGALAATAGVLLAPVAWRPTRGASAGAQAGLVGLALLLLLGAPTGSGLVLAALPAVVSLAALCVWSVVLRVQEPQRKPGANDYLWTSLLLACGYGLVVAVLA